MEIEIYNHTELSFTMIVEKKDGESALADDVDYVLTATGTATITPVDERDQQLRVVEQLRAKKQKIRADAQIAVEKIDDRIQSLLAISYEDKR